MIYFYIINIIILLLTKSLLKIQKCANVGYTKQDNPYQKSNIGKNIGTAVGIGMLLPATKYVAKRNGVSFSRYVSEFMEKFKESIRSAKPIFTPSTSMGRNVFNFFSKHKSARVATVAFFTLTPVIVYVGIGRLLGHGIDKIIDNSAKKQADIDAKSQKA